MSKSCHVWYRHDVLLDKQYASINESKTSAVKVYGLIFLRTSNHNIGHQKELLYYSTRMLRLRSCCLYGVLFFLFNRICIVTIYQHDWSAGSFVCWHGVWSNLRSGVSLSGHFHALFICMLVQAIIQSFQVIFELVIEKIGKVVFAARCCV